MGHLTMSRKFIKSITRLVLIGGFIISILVLVFSCTMAAYSTIKLGTPYPLEELSGKCLDAILGLAFVKTFENVVEHNDSWLFGKSRKEKSDESISEETDQP